MEIVIEKQDVNRLMFDPDKNYPIYQDFDRTKILGTCKVFREEDKIMASLNKNVGLCVGYPAIACRTLEGNKKVFVLEHIGVCGRPNTDPTIEKITFIPK